MTLRLTKLQKQLSGVLQDGLPICQRPFDDIARFMGITEQIVLRQTTRLKAAGVIRRIAALINYRTLGFSSTLVAAHIPPENLPEVTAAVNSLENVSHNYLRTHHYNLWFTLQAGSLEEADITLANLSARFGLDFHSLPVVHIFKLDVRFDPDNQNELLDNAPQAPTPPRLTAQAVAGVHLNDTEKLLLAKLQNDLQVIPKPFDFLCGKDLAIEDILRILNRLTDKGVIRRIAAALDHHKLGFVANVLFVAKVGPDRIIEAGNALARFGIVSHCCQRRCFENWPYNLFAMMHSRSMGEIQHIIDRFTQAQKIDSFELLPTAAELKKQPVKYRF
jgi:DNA-binding Lrp family transcriptional regulator